MRVLVPILITAWRTTAHETIPVRITQAPSGEPLVTLTSAQTNTELGPNLRYASRRVLKSMPSIDVSIEQFLAMDECEVLPMPVLLLQAGRSGADLLTNMLAEDARWKIVDEPNAVTSLQNYMRFNRHIDGDDAAKNFPKLDVLKKIIHLLACRTSPSQEAVFINFHSQNIWMLELLRDATKPLLGDGPQFMYLFREAVDLAKSLYDYTPDWVDDFPGSTKAKRIRSYLESVTAFLSQKPWVEVTWYAHVINLQLVHQLYNMIDRSRIMDDLAIGRPGPSPSQALKERMWSIERSSVVAGPHGIEYGDYNLWDIERCVKDEVLYHPQLVDFKVKNTLAFFDRSIGAPNPTVYDWQIPSERDEALEIIAFGTHPIAIINAINDWPWDDINALGYDEITRKYVERQKNDKDVNCLVATHNENWFTWHSKEACRKWPWGEHYQVSAKYASIPIEEFLKRRDLYIVSWKAQQPGQPRGHMHYDDFDWKIPRQLWDAFHYDRPCRKKPWSWRAGHAGQTSPLHSDHGNTFIVQLYGSKHMALWDSRDVEDGNMHLYPQGHCMFRRVYENGLNSDNMFFPDGLGKKARIVQGEVKQGQILFFPSMWPHYTTATSDSHTLILRTAGGSAPGTVGTPVGKLKYADFGDWLKQNEAEAEWDMQMSGERIIDMAERRHKYAKGWAKNEHSRHILMSHMHDVLERSRNERHPGRDTDYDADHDADRDRGNDPD